MNKTTPSGHDSKADPPHPHRGAFDDEARRRSARSDDAHAFVRDPADHKAPDDDLAEALGEDFVASATSGEEVTPEVFDGLVPEEEGGPFMNVSGDGEFAAGTDASNPPEAERAGFPTANAVPAKKRRAR
ncbi:MAG: hypothetical protein U0326_42595 [Polyangiales bacterium]